AGRLLTTADDAMGAPRTALISARAWRTRYGSDPAIAGRVVAVDGVATTVIGVLPDRSGLPSTADVWLPLAAMPEIATARRDARLLQVFARLGERVPEAAARGEVETIIRQQPESQIATGKPVRVRVAPISEHFFGKPTDPAWLSFLAAACLVLIIATANA